ncbi:aldo/keto reductase [Acidithiobacillus sp. CV18-2]|uniref:Aldo/keto reductase n=1 Tax=Igneacidithiobacillus copahuensis TaxID=2724909 RepID=A0AAE2YRE7_9PROT|nr:aldo/keto reductase [Igneacidithiobacillus copahuensis]MBU2754765.1 aldo/keto reductase [Acidithiobacillus sp. CV18-3]MBU2758401.1 aldo/keto reductase [Acidithiobacillus sp. BN09-2]MBU2776719.1 aldo/keto reductase [Acidithiobacillus sp. CV18-2]MBU2795452.1 aldo/keto reductase [Acidithiobacillus sp. VAN18-2]MBU2799012.1 aldo/keto reductase [Acidithiobacillus sp. VAN18-4]UTV81576.1 aldo/keto reductase [Acidithiobacillus sp. YTS05]
MSDTPDLVPGAANSLATKKYAERFVAAGLPEGHYSDFLNTRIKLSSLGVGTFPGAIDEVTDVAVAAIVAQALQSGINVIDTGANYRYGRAGRAVGAGIAKALQAGIQREEFFVLGKGGFLTFANGKPENLETFFAEEVEAKGRGKKEDLAHGIHCLSPEYLLWQLDELRAQTGLATLDAFLVDQPEVQIPVIGKEQVYRKLIEVFAALEGAVAEGKLRYYGISTFNACRVETDNPLFQSMTSLLGLAEKAAGEGKRHHLRIVELPFNALMPEAYTRFSQVTGQGNIASTIQAAYQLKLTVMASHPLGKGLLGREEVPSLQEAMPELANAAQRATQFVRSTPGIAVTLVGMSNPLHLADFLAVAQQAPLEKERFLAMFEKEK